MNLASSIQLIAIMCPHFPGFIVNEDFVVVVEDHKTKAMKKSKESLHGCDMDLKLPAIQAVEKLAACLHKKINATISDQQQEIDFQANLRKDMGEKLALYVCQDDSLSTSQSIANKSWTYINNDVTPPKASEEMVQILFESDHSALYLVHNFFKPEECDALLAHSQVVKNFETETMNIEARVVPLAAKESSPFVQSTIHKIQSMAAAFLRAKLEYTKDPMLTVLIKKATFDALASQECTMDSQDGTCVGTTSEKTSQLFPPKIQITEAKKIDTAVLNAFCTVPEAGGHIHFPKAGVHLNLKESGGHALFMIYTDTDKGIREDDPFIEEYVECPVQRGKLTIISDSFSVRYV